MDLGDFAGEGTISDEDGGSWTDGGWKTLVGASNLGGVTFDGIVDHDLKGLSCDELNWLGISQKTGSNLWTLGVEHNGTGLIWSLLKGLLKVLKRLSMGFVITVGEIKSCDVHSSVKHLDEHINIPAGWSVKMLK